MKIKNLFFLIIFIVIGYLINEKLAKNEEKSEVVLKFQKRVERVSEIDINNAVVEDFLSRGISITKAEKIIKFRETVGCINNLNEISRIKGFGTKTLESLNGKFIVKEKELKRNRFDINDTSEEILGWYGFTKKEVIEIKRYKEKKGRVYSNLDFESIVSPERYIEFKDLIIYNRY